ncbi:MAG: sensor histidine kinase [Arcobacter sp.]|nr:MAG: sensor histidine kinase [Arcobacter sp.]
MHNITIKMKLIIIFVLIKIIPLLIISYIAYKGVLTLDEYLNKNTQFLFKQSEKVIIDTANESINDSIKNLNKKSQISLEKLSYQIANTLAQFLYQRDEDILFLSKLELNQKILEQFYTTKKREIIIHGEYTYDDEKNVWTNKKPNKNQITKEKKKAILRDNKKEFNFTDPINYKTQKIPIYKEVSYFNLKGNEKYKISKINKNLMNISKKENTYINSESYFDKISTLEVGQIYVSDVIGEYRPSKIIGTFTKERAMKANIKFEPKNHAYAGRENPVGKKFEAIIRFITPIYKNGKKTGYLSLALDHEHIMQFTDTINPTSINTKQDIADASIGNYAFMWNYQGKNISHPRDYFIVGYDKNTGQEVDPWVSSDIAKKQKLSKKNMHDFLKEYPKFENQSLEKKPNLEQLVKNGNVPLDCRYLNFAPQCQGWMRVTENGGYGSFLIYWSKVWKLTTAASIPYYTGQYANTKRGFGFITIGANVDEFHSAANKTRENVNNILKTQTKHIKDVVEKNNNQINHFIKNIINELSVITTIMVFIVIIVALWLSNYISGKIEKLLIGTNKFANNELDYRIEISSDDEIGKLEKSFNKMASKISYLIAEEKKINETLEMKIEEGIKKHRKQEEILIQQSKLASMGEMIGNIAHQWRQPLNALSLLIQNIQLLYQLGQLDDEYMEKSVKKAKLLTTKMSRTIDDFRNFFMPNKTKKIFSLNNSIRESINIMDSMLKHHQIKITINFEKEKISSEGYPNEFSQALLNILNNSKDAIIQENIKNPEILIHLYEKDSFAIIEISDNAKGIPKDILDKVFEPYFTTKHQSQGTGIGLYMTKTIIENNMQGNLSVYNSKDGAVFTIKMPLVKNEEIIT